MKADAILMHRTKNIIAVRAQQSETCTIVQVRKRQIILKIWLTQIFYFRFTIWILSKNLSRLRSPKP
jgi:hypothetical protein